MYESTVELAENKLLVLYVIKSIKIPISNKQITEIILQNGFINYFTLQQYISELVSSKFIQYSDRNDKKLLLITDRGEKVLSLFKDRLATSKTDIIDNYIKDQIENIKKELTLTATYTVDENNNFIVNLRAIENDSLLIDLKLNVASNKQAIHLCNKWKSNSSEIYNKIMQLLITS